VRNSELNEHEIADSADTWRIDQLIDQVIARGGSVAPAGPAVPAGADEGLVTELSGLGPVEWPADESGARIARMVASRAGRQQHRGRGERGRLVAGAGRPRPVARARRSR
jgi:hypothetical protein